MPYLGQLKVSRLANSLQGPVTLIVSFNAMEVTKDGPFAWYLIVRNYLFAMYTIRMLCIALSYYGSSPRWQWRFVNWPVTLHRWRSSVDVACSELNINKGALIWTTSCRNYPCLEGLIALCRLSAQKRRNGITANDGESNYLHWPIRSDGGFGFSFGGQHGKTNDKINTMR